MTSKNLSLRTTKENYTLFRSVKEDNKTAKKLYIKLLHNFLRLKLHEESDEVKDVYYHQNRLEMLFSVESSQGGLELGTSMIGDQTKFRYEVGKLLHTNH